MFKKVLSPDRVKVLVALFVLSLPLWSERITLESGEVLVERVVPITLLPVYLMQGSDLQSILLVLGFYLFVYIIAASVVEFFRQFVKK